MAIGLSSYLAVAAILFTIGVVGIFLNRKNIIIILMSVELILLAVNLNFVAFSSYLGDLVGQVFALFVLTVAAAEAAIGWLLAYPVVSSVLIGARTATQVEMNLKLGDWVLSTDERDELTKVAAG